MISCIDKTTKRKRDISYGVRLMEESTSWTILETDGRDANAKHQQKFFLY